MAQTHQQGGGLGTFREVVDILSGTNEKLVMRLRNGRVNKKSPTCTPLKTQGSTKELGQVTYVDAKLYSLSVLAMDSTVLFHRPNIYNQSQKDDQHVTVPEITTKMQVGANVHLHLLIHVPVSQSWN